MKLTIGQMPLTQQLLQAGQQLCLSIILLTSIPAAAVKAQITPDGSLPTNVQKLQEIMKINGGERAGNNLFHSFDEFNVPEGMKAVFENGLDIENIFTRITGDSISNLDGILSTQGTANLFLVNPNGIVFGENAALNVGGSFIVTTADSIKFNDGATFSASDTDSDPILTIEFPIGMGFDNITNLGTITVNGNGNQITQPTGIEPTLIENSGENLNVESGNTLGLIGSNVTLDGGTVDVESGRIEIGSIDSGTVGIRKVDSGFAFDYSNVNNYQNINIINQSVLNSSDEGNISLSGHNITFKEGSLALIQNQGASKSGNLNINANQSLTLTGVSNNGNVSSVIRSEALDTGIGASIAVKTPILILEDGAIIGTSTFNNALGGNIDVDALNSIQLLKNENVNPARSSNLVSGIGTTTYASGNAGNIQLSTKKLTILDGGLIGSPTVAKGDGGDIDLQAETVEVLGTNKTGTSFSSVLASSSNEGDAGNVTINTSQLKLTGGGTVNSSSLSEGNAGSVTINASDKIEVTGIASNIPDSQPSQIASSTINPSEALRQLFGITSTPRGNAGNVNINTPFLNVNQSGEIGVRNEGTGDGGSLSINVGQLNLDKSGIITAATASGNGGNINITADDLQIDNNSEITATAEGSGEGGNVNINTTNLTAKKTVK